MKNQNAVELGRLGGQKKSERKKLAGQKNLEIARKIRWQKIDKKNP